MTSRRISMFDLRTGILYSRSMRRGFRFYFFAFTTGLVRPDERGG